jgi:hypothetical protein
VLFGAVLLLLGCGSGGSQEDAVATVERFFTALADGDRAVVADLAPDLPVEGDTAAMLRRSLSGEVETAVVQVTVEGRSALVAVETRVDGEVGPTLLVPLRWRPGGWRIGDSITVQRTFDVIEIEADVQHDSRYSRLLD